MSHAHTVPFGPVSFDNPWIDNFSYEDVKESHCVAQVATNISQRLIEVAQLEGKKFLAVCCPAYNEESEDRGLCEVIIAKQRNGPTGTVKLKFFKEWSRFDNYMLDGS